MARIERTCMGPFLSSLLCGIAIISSSPVVAEGLESVGNTDGVLTWRLGDLAPGAEARETVLFAFADGYDQLVARMSDARTAFKNAPARPSSAQPASTSDPVWIKNADTDLALDGNGAFFWEGVRQALTCTRGGQLSRLSYYVHYGDGAPQRAGAFITQKGRLENLVVVEPIHALDDRQASGVLETADKKLRIRICAIMGSGPVAAVEFVMTNIGPSPLSDVRLTAYSNLEANHDSDNDYSWLDSRIEGLLVVDVPTRTCVGMAGGERPATGYSGVWASGDALREAKGLPFDQWKAFENLPSNERLFRSLIPHPPAPLVDPVEPETRTLTKAEAAAALERDWLFQADGKAPDATHRLDARARDEIAWARELAARLEEGPVKPKLKRELARLKDLEAQLDAVAAQPPDEAAAKRLYLEVRRAKRDILFKNPVVDFSQVLFIDNPYTQGAEWPHQARHRDGMMAVPGGRLLVLDGLHPGGVVRKLAPEKPGSFWRPDLSFDAKRVLFCFKPHDEKSFHLYEINLDGTGLRQVTSSDYDDLDPIYLPDGHLLFSTSRCNTYVRCMPYTYCYILARCDADGRNIYIVSPGNEPEYLPALLDDGRVIFTRWEYTDKALWRIQSLWTINPDGADLAVYWGNQSVWPDMLIEPRPIPGSQRILFTGSAHHDWFAGSVGVLDRRQGVNFPNGLTKITTDVEWPESGNGPVDPAESPRYHRSGAYDAYKTPYPLGEKDFLVSARSGGKYRLYLMDVDGNRELIYEGAHHIWHAAPVKPRKCPPVLPDRVAWPGTGSERKPPEPGVLYSSNVYQGVPDLTPGSAKYLQVIQLDPKTYSTWERDIEPCQFSGPATSILQAEGVKRILGTAPVQPDGSVSFKVPPGKALHFQLLDENYRALQTMRSFTGVMPGEHRGCVGCHEMHSTAPPLALGAAVRSAPADLTPPPWGAGETVGYERFVQPVLDTYCARCHEGSGEAREKLDLTLRPGLGVFKEPYVTLVKGGIAGAIMVEAFDQRDPNAYVTFRPMKHLSYTSKLVENAMSGKHHDVKVEGADLRRLIAWVDANCPYRGDEEIRAIPDPDFPGIEALPIRPRCKTAPYIERP